MSWTALCKNNQTKTLGPITGQSYRHHPSVWLYFRSLSSEYAAVNKKSSRGRAVVLQPPCPPTPPLWVKEDQPIIAIDYYQRQTPCRKIEGAAAGGGCFLGRRTHVHTQVYESLLWSREHYLIILKHLISWWLWENSIWQQIYLIFTSISLFSAFSRGRALILGGGQGREGHCIFLFDGILTWWCHPKCNYFFFLKQISTVEYRNHLLFLKVIYILDKKVRMLQSDYRMRREVIRFIVDKRVTLATRLQQEAVDRWKQLGLNKVLLIWLWWGIMGGMHMRGQSSCLNVCYGSSDCKSGYSHKQHHFTVAWINLRWSHQLIRVRFDVRRLKIGERKGWDPGRLPVQQHSSECWVFRSRKQSTASVIFVHVRRGLFLKDPISKNSICPWKKMRK